MREKFNTRSVLLVGEIQRETAIQVIKNAPLDPIKPLEIVVREQVKVRKPDQNSLMWSGPLKDIAEQGWIDGRRFSAEVWHSFFKAEFLPEQHEEGITKEGYRKYDIDPAGNRVLVGSTTQLTVRGFSDYLEQVYAHGASLGVQFHVRAAA